MKLLPATLAAALVLAAPAYAATPINETLPLDADGKVRIENPSGQVTVRTWDRREVKITGSLGEGSQKRIVQGGPRDLAIEIRGSRQGGLFGWMGGSTEPTRLEITVPRRASLEVDAVSAGVDVAGTDGRALTLSSVSGDVLVRKARAVDADLQTVSGDLDAELDTNALSADSVSGRLRIAGRVGGRVQLNSVSGDASVVASGVERLALSTVSGDGDIKASLAPSGRVEADTVSGDLSLTMPSGTSARLQVETFSGDITSPVGKVRREEHGPGQSLDTRLGAGSGGINLESFSGDVRVIFD